LDGDRSVMQEKGRGRSGEYDDIGDWWATMQKEEADAVQAMIADRVAGEEASQPQAVAKRFVKADDALIGQLFSIASEVSLAHGAGWSGAGWDGI
jgi:hypothetical protein